MGHPTGTRLLVPLRIITQLPLQMLHAEPAMFSDISHPGHPLCKDTVFSLASLEQEALLYFFFLRASSMGYSCSSVVSSTDMVLTLNSWSVTWSARLQTALSIIKLLALALIIVPGMMLLAQGRCAAAWPRDGARHACLSQLLSVPSDKCGPPIAGRSFLCLCAGCELAGS